MGLRALRLRPDERFGTILPISFTDRLLMLRSGGHLLAGLAGFLGMAWIGAVAAITARQRQLLFDPVRSSCPDCPSSSGHYTSAVVLRGSDDTQLCGWLATPRTAGPHPAVIYFGGRSEEISWVVREAGTMFRDMALLAVNYRGCGGSQGSPGERQVIADGRMLFDWLTQTGSGIDRKRVAMVGRSLGSGVVMQVAAHRPVAAIVLLTPFDSVLAMVRKKLPSMPVGWMLRHRFESVRHARHISAPVMILRAELDDIVPHVHTDALVSELTTVVRDDIIPGSSHCDVPHLPETKARIAEFLREHLLCATEPVSSPVLACTPEGRETDSGMAGISGTVMASGQEPGSELFRLRRSSPDFHTPPA